MQRRIYDEQRGATAATVSGCATTTTTTTDWIERRLETNVKSALTLHSVERQQYTTTTDWWLLQSDVLLYGEVSDKDKQASERAATRAKRANGQRRVTHALRAVTRDTLVETANP